MASEFSTILPVPQEIVCLQKLLGVEMYVVGGVVRDHLFSQFHGHTFEPKDFDVATPEHPETIASLLHGKNVADLGIRCLEIGKSFGVVAAVFPSGNTYEIATFRKEWYDPESGDGRRPDKVEFATAEEDAQRRDLTINSLFYSIENKSVIDFTGQGIEDIRNVVIRPVGNAIDRYREDRLRVLRTVRFYSRYRVGNIVHELDPDTLYAIGQWKDLPGVSGERIVAEFLGGLRKSLLPGHFVRSLRSLDLLPAMFPGLSHRYPVVDTRNHAIMLACMFPDEPAGELTKKLNALKYDGDTCKHVSFLKSLLHFSPEKAYDYVRSRDRFDDPGETRVGVRAGRRLALCNEVEEFCHCNGLDKHPIDKLMNFYPSTNASMFGELSGVELGEAIRQGINEEFAHFLKV